MGNMRPIDSAVVKNETYDVLSADTMGGEYIETIGAACQNPDGYTSGSLFLGKDNDVQHLYRATAAIAFGETIILDTNCVYTTVSGELEGKAEESEVSSLNEALTNLRDNLTDIHIIGTTNNTGSSIARGTFLYLNGILIRTKTTIANGATFTENTNYEVITAGALNSILGYKWDRISVPSTYVQSDRNATITFVKSAGVCNVFWSGGSLKVPAMQTEYEIGDIPTEFIPDADVIAFFTDANTSANSIYFKLTSQGKVKVYSYNANGNINVAPNVTYIRYGS